MSQRRELALGIDFGVATTVAAIAGFDEPEVIADDEGNTVIPSVIAFSPVGRDIIGEAAKARKPIDPANTLHSVKRIIGEVWTSPQVRSFIEQYPFFTLERHDDGLPRFATRQGLLTAEEVATKIIEHVIGIVERGGFTPSFAVVGVPSAFSNRARKATRRAVVRAGFEEVLVVAEPLAIAWACVHKRSKPDRTLAVFDVGGGTFDLAICEIRGGGVSLIASGGDEYLGGDDIDRLVASWVVEQVLRREQWDVRTSPEAMARLLAASERAKIALTARKLTTIELHEVEESELLIDKSVHLERPVFEDLTTDFVRRTFGVCDEVISKAGINVSDIDEVCLAGGSTHIPSLRAAVARYFGKTPQTFSRPETLVARGTALIAQATAVG